MLEILLVLALLTGVFSLGAFSFARFWKGYRIDHDLKAFRHFLQQLEIVGTLTQAELSVEVTKLDSGLRLKLQGALPLPDRQLELSQVDRLLIDQQPTERLIWHPAGKLCSIQIELVGKLQRRELRWTGRVVRSEG